MADSKRLVKNTMYLYIKTGLTVFIVLYTTRLILRGLGETDFGIFNIVGGIISMLGFLNTAMAVTIQRFLNYEQGKGNMDTQKTIFNVGVLLHIIIAVVMAIVMVVFGFFLFNGIINIPSERTFAAQVVYGSLIISTFFTILTVPYDACLNAHENMLYYSIVGIIEAFLRLGVAIIVVNSSYDKLILYGILMALIPIFSMSLMSIYCHKKYAECRVSLRKYFDNNIARKLFSFAGWILMGSSSNYLGNYGNMIVMNHFYGVGLNTVMGIANQIQGQLQVLSTGMLKALNPVIAKEEGAGNTEKMMLISLQSCRYSYFLLAIFALPMFIEIESVLNFWLGEYPSWTLLFVRLQLLRALLEQMTVTLNKALEARGKIGIFNCITFVSNLLPIPILCLLYTNGFPPYYHYVVAITLMVVVPSIAKLVLCNVYCSMKFDNFLKQVAIPTTIPTLIIIAVCMILMPKVFDSPLARIISTTIFSTIVQLTTIYCLIPYSIKKQLINRVKLRLK